MVKFPKTLARRMAMQLHSCKLFATIACAHGWQHEFDRLWISSSPKLQSQRGDIWCSRKQQNSTLSRPGRHLRKQKALDQRCRRGDLLETTCKGNGIKSTATIRMNRVPCAMASRTMHHVVGRLLRPRARCCQSADFGPLASSMMWEDDCVLVGTGELRL